MPVFDKHVIGVLCGLMAFFAYSLMDVSIKWLAGLYPVTLVIFLQSSGIVLILLLYALTRGQMATLRATSPAKQLLRACIHIIAGWSSYHSFTQLPLASFYTVGFLAPLVIALLAWVVYGEKPTRRTQAALLLGFAGMLVIMQPDTLPLNTGTLLALVSIFVSGINVMFVRALPKDHPNTFVIYSHTLLVLTATPFAIPHLADFDWSLYPVSFAGAACSVIAGYFFYSAYRHAPAALVAPTQYTQLLWGALAGWFVFGHGLTLWLVLGAVLIIGAGLLVVTQTRGNPTPPTAARRLPRIE